MRHRRQLTSNGKWRLLHTQSAQRHLAQSRSGDIGSSSSGDGSCSSGGGGGVSSDDIKSVNAGPGSVTTADDIPVLLCPLLG